jgi:hypothetical protein|tara:strand:+ start:1095 stop:1388 length:294 start_codon:yes stop_codon:yes gene_type:complete
MSKLDKFIEEVVNNIRKDREITKRLLDDAIVYLSKDEERHREIGIIVAKYVETLQRSNDQLVKISTIVQRKESKNTGLSDFDKEELFDIIQSGGTDE